MPSTSGCWKNWDTEHRLCLTLRIVMDDGASKFLQIRLDSETKAVTVAEITDIKRIPKS